MSAPWGLQQVGSSRFTDLAKVAKKRGGKERVSGNLSKEKESFFISPVIPGFGESLVYYNREKLSNLFVLTWVLLVCCLIGDIVRVASNFSEQLQKSISDFLS